MANDIPRLSGLTGTLTFAENTVNAAPQRLDADVSFSDADFYDGILRVTGLLAEDRIEIATDGVISLSGNNVLYNGAIVGQFSGGQGGNFVVYFNGAATAPAAEALIEHLTYRNLSDRPTATRTLSLSIMDAAADVAQPGFSATPDAGSPFTGINVGTFSKPVLADLNGDGRLDLVVGADDGTLRTYLRNADGSVSEQTGAANPFNGIDVGSYSTPALGDLNGDGRLDLVVGENNGTLRTYLRNADGSVSAQTGAANPFNGIDVGFESSPALGDLDGDGRLDLVVGANDGTLRTYLRNADGSVSAQAGAANPFNGIDVGSYSKPALVDLNGDGRLDLVVGAYDGTLRTYLRNADGSVSAQTGTANPFNGMDVGDDSAPALADLDGDGRLDLVVGAQDGTLRSYTGGTGLSIAVAVTAENDLPTFSGLGGRFVFDEDAVNAGPQRLDTDVRFADLDFDGGTLSVTGLLAEDRVGLATDGVITRSGSSVLYNGTVVGSDSGGQGTPFVVQFNGSATAAAVEAVIEHLTYQNLSDTPTATRRLTIDVTDAAGAHVSPVFATTPDASSPFSGIDVGNYSAPALGDLDGDGRLDLVVGANDGTLRTYLRNADGSVSEQTGAANPFNGIDVGSYSTPALGDLNGDGRLDLVVGENNGTLRTYLRNADGSVSAQTGAANPFNGIHVDRYSAPALVDLNGDGRLDLVVGADDGTLRTYLRNADGSVSEQTGAANPFNGIDVVNFSKPALVDLNGDGRLDLVVGDGGGTLRTYLRGADGSYSEQTGAANPFSGIDVGDESTPVLADLDGDGRLDLVVGASDGTLRSYTRGLSTAVTVTAENDAPTLTGVSGALTLRRDGAGATPQSLFGGATFADRDSLPSAVTVSGLVAGDRVTLATDAVIGLSGSSILYNGTAIGFLTGGDGGTLTVSFTGATAAAVTAVIRHLTFETATGATSSRDLQVTLTDAAGGSTSPAPLTVTYDASTVLTGLDLGGHDGTLRAGESVSLTMRFTGPVDVTGTPVLTLSDGGTAAYVSGAGTASLVFSHSVARGQNTADLTVTGLQGGTIRDGLGQDLSPIPAGGIDPAGTLRVDTLAPDAPAVTGPAAGATLLTTVPTITGTAEAGSRVLVSIDGEQSDTVVAGSDGRFSLTVTDPLGLGAHSVAVTAIDAAGNISTARTAGFTVSDGRPTGLALAAGDDTGASASDGLTAKAAVTVSGNGLSGTTVQVLELVEDGEVLLGEVEVVDGRFSAAVTLTGDGLHRILAVQSGENGFSFSDPLDVTLDTRAPTVTGLAVTGPGLVAGAGTLTVGQTATLTLTLSEAVRLANTGGLRLTLNDGGTALFDAAASDATHLVFRHTVLVDQLAADLAVTGITLGGASLQDAAGNAADLAAAVTNPAGTLRIDGLTGTAAAETFRGTTGADTFRGLGGNDTYFVDTSGDVVQEDANAGTDTVQSSVTFTLGANIENLTLTGTVAINGTGNALANTLIGNAAANVLDGGAGADILRGGLGNDSYAVDSAADQVIEAADQGTDTLVSTVSYVLRAGQAVETLQFASSTGAAALTLTGNELANTLIGNAGDNILTGGAGADILKGGLGNDVYAVDSAADQVIEAADQGTDTLVSTVSYVLRAGQAVETLQFASSTGAAALTLTGNELANTLIGNGGDNILTGGAGADILKGGLGNDVYGVDNAADQVVEAANGGTDTLVSTVSYVLRAGQAVETLQFASSTGAAALTLTGNELANTLIGNGGDNILTGGAGADILKGGLGNDVYAVDNAADQVVEAANGGTDTLVSTVSYVLRAGQGVETLQFASSTGATALTLTGNELANTLIGNAGDNILTGGAGADILKGGLGNDVYGVDNAADQVVEAANGGTDTLVSTVSYVLRAGQAVETLQFASSTGAAALTLTGNELANTLIGNGGDNILTGGAGADILRGGLGNDVYVTDGGDTITEAANAGTDTVQSSATLVLGANLENLTLTGTAAINGTGNALANAIIGNAAANVLSGLGGLDKLTGGGGADTFVFKALADSTVASTGQDTIMDFARSQGDHIDLYFIDANTGMSGDQAFAFIGDAAFTKHAGELRAVVSDVNTVVSGDVDGNGTADFSIILQGTITLQQADFIL